MKSVFRIYAKTSKGNDNHLLKQLKSFNLSPKYDQHMNSFYFNSTWKALFDLSFNSLTVQQMYIQIGQNFRMIDEQQIKTQLQRLPFKNYIPIQRGLIQSTTLKILTRESVHLPSQNVLINLITNNLNKEITKKEYFKQIQSQTSQSKLLAKGQQRGMLEYKRQRKNDLSYFDIKDAVQRKWWQEDQQKDQQRNQKILSLQNLLEKQNEKHKKLLLQHNLLLNNQNKQKGLILTPLIEQSQNNLISIKSQINELKNYSAQNYLSEQLAYHPHLIFYIRKNKGRFLLKINKDNLYKHGWKNQVNWGPIRESIAASIIHQSKILQQGQQKQKLAQKKQNNIQKSQSEQKRTIKIWDPMCGSGTFGLVATTMLQQVPVRSDIQKQFQWVHWPVYKKEYLSEYWRQKQAEKKNKGFNYQLILSDKDRQTINYSIDNFRLLMEGVDKNKSNQINSSINQQEKTQKLQNRKDNVTSSQLFPSKTPKSEVLQLIPDKVGFACGDFQTVMQLIKQKVPSNHVNDKLTIITNLPYLHGRSESKYPLNQLTSIYSRFSQMINSNKDFIENVFIIIDKNINDKRHFLNVSSLEWNLIGQYNSGGMEIGLYAWAQNKIKSKFDQDNLTQLNENALVEYQKIKGQISSQDRQLILKKQKTVANALIQLRKKLSQIDRKYYNLPKHLVRDAHGWKRVMEKRRKRHLQSAYQLFAKRRDKLIALKQYAREKLQLKALRRGTVWKNKNLRFFDFSQEKLEQYSQQIKKVFEQKIEQALKKKQALQQKRKLKSGDKIETVKIRNKWNNDERKLVKQIKNSKGRQTMGRKQSTVKKTNRVSQNHKR